MKVVIVGSGGRELALARVLGRHHQVIVTPGNPGIDHRTNETALALAKHGWRDLVVVGPEQPLVDGLADELRALGVPVFGPGADGAVLEGSKPFMKGLVTAANVPTAEYRAFSSLQVEEATHYAAELIMNSGSCAVKTGYLKGGKGVGVFGDIARAAKDIATKLAPQPGVESPSIVIEAGLSGPEVSVFAICDGTRSICLPAAQDYKRAYDGDKGPNTGGMGARSPLPFLPKGFEAVVDRKFIQPTLAELRSRGIDYRGVLYAGLMLTSDGPKLLEYNIRFGDPDSQVVLMRLAQDYDLGALLLAAAEGDMSQVASPRFNDETAVLVVGAAEGYPESPRLGDPINGLDAAANMPGVDVLTAGVAFASQVDGSLMTAGGRVVNVVGFGPDAGAARAKAYGALRAIGWPGKWYRDDIALKPDT